MAEDGRKKTITVVVVGKGSDKAFRGNQVRTRVGPDYFERFLLKESPYDFFVFLGFERAGGIDQLAAPCKRQGPSSEQLRLSIR